MTVETKFQGALTKIRAELRELRADITAIANSSGTALSANETIAGVLEIATQDEVNAGVDNTRAITPLKFQTRLAAFAQPLSDNLTALAGVVSGATGRALLGATTAAGAKTTLALAKVDVGLGSVDNTSDVSKPVSTAQQTALNLKANLASPAFTGTPVAPTAVAGTNSTQIATTAFTVAAIASSAPAPQAAASETTSGIVELATQVETDAGTDDVRAVTPLKFQTRLAAFAQPLNTNLTTLAGVVSGVTGRSLLTAATAAAAKTTLALVKGDVGLANVDNTSDAAKPVSTAQQTALNLKADLSSPSLTGIPTAPTAVAGTNTTQLATTAFAAAAVASATPVASETVSGLIELATQGETDTGTDAVRAITPSKLQARLTAFAQPLNTNLTTLAGVVSGAMGRTLLGAADASAARTSLGLAAVAVSGSASDITTGTLPTSVLPPLAINDTFPVTSQAAMLALTAQRGDVAVRSDINRTFILAAEPATTLANWTQINGASDVTSVAGRTGAVSLTKTDVGLVNVDNTADTAKPVSTAQQSALDLKANLASPALTGTPTAPTPAAGTSTTQVATTAFATSAITAATPAASETVTGIVRLATQAETDTGTDNTRSITPAKLQTRLTAFAQPLNSNLTTLAGVVSGAMGRTLLAAADAATAKTALALTKSDVGLGSVDNTSDVAKPVSTAQQNALNLKANLVSPLFTGAPSGPTAPSGTSTDQFATTTYVQAAMGDLSSGMAGIIDGGGVAEGSGGAQGLNDGGAP